MIGQWPERLRVARHSEIDPGRSPLGRYTEIFLDPTVVCTILVD